MHALEGKKILLGVCGGIAAYKAAFLVRLLVKSGAEVQVIMTPDASHFITPLTLSTLSGKPVLTEYFDGKTGLWNNHVHLALWADLMIVAPATAHTLAKFANGICDNLLVATYLSAKAPVFLAPAMDLDMWVHGSTRENLGKLRAYGNYIVPPGSGELASGLIGEGRLAEPEDIVQFVTSQMQGVKQGGLTDMDLAHAEQPLAGRKVMVSAGPTFEAIDPVRFIGNHSSGKMGIALAEALLSFGAEVTLVHGPVDKALIERVDKRITRIAVVSAEEMKDACVTVAPAMDAIIMAAAVADYTPAEVANHKIKKSAEDLQIVLKKTPDILAALGKQKPANQILVGFALETDNEEANARGKMERKNLDFIVLNSLRDHGAGFGVDTNQVSIFAREGVEPVRLGLQPKSQIAREIIKHTLARLFRN